MNWFTFSNEVEAHCNVASTASFTLVLFISTKSKSSSKLGQKLKQKNLRELLMQNSDFWGPVVWIFVTIFWTIVTFLRFWGTSEAFFCASVKKSGFCNDGRIAWWYGIEQKVGCASACKLSTIRHLRRHFRFGFGGLRRRERGDGGVGLLFAVLGGGEVVHLFEKA